MVALHQELEPAAAGELPFRGEEEAAVGLEALHAEAVEDIAGADQVGVRAAAARADATHPPVQETAQAPQPVGEIPTGVAADTPDGPETVLR